VEKLRAGRRLIRTYYYNAPVNQPDNPTQYQDQQKFFARLADIPYFEVKLGRLEKRPGGLVEKGVDLTMAVDMLRAAYGDNYDTAILITGDGDFAYVVQTVKDRGKHVENAFVRAGCSKALRNACDAFVPLDQEFLRDIFFS